MPDRVRVRVAPEDLLVAVDVAGELPLEGVERVGEHELRDPLVDLAPALRLHAGHVGGHAEVDEQPLVLGLVVEVGIGKAVPYAGLVDISIWQTLRDRRISIKSFCNSLFKG